MAKMTVGQKAERTLRFLMGLRNAEVAAELRRRGFTDEDRVEGYMLLARLTADRLAEEPPPPDPESLLRQLDAWENYWFPIVAASTRVRFPAAHERLFRNVRQEQGVKVVFTVGTMLRRLEELATSDGVEGPRALAHLARRGLDAERIAQGRRLIESVAEVEAAPPHPEPGAEELARAEAELWGWYLEWSAIARGSITSRRMLRALGYRAGKRGSEEDAAEAGA